MSIIVQKYGGSSVADADKIKKIAGMVAKVKSFHDVVVVVSAIGKTTNSLIEMAKSVTSNPPKREMDMLLSTGERITMSLLCMALNELGFEAISLTGSQCGIITTDRHNDARVIEVRPFRVQDELSQGKIVVVGGFQGVSYRRDITTLGRGGSDTTAIALAAALNAERCEIYSDIDGVYSADPSAIAEAKHLPEISYQEMQEMSIAGAKVLNANAVQFAKEAQIAIYARSTFNPGKETIVRKLPPGFAKGVKAVVSESDIVRAAVHGEHADNDFRNIISFFNKEQISFKELSYGVNSSNKDFNRISFVISLPNIHSWETIKEKLLSITQNRISFEDNLGAVSLIGEGVNEDLTTLSETIKLLNDNGINVTGLTTTSFRISLLVDKASLKESIKLCHHKWIEENK